MWSILNVSPLQALLEAVCGAVTTMDETACTLHKIKRNTGNDVASHKWHASLLARHSATYLYLFNKIIYLM